MYIIYTASVEFFPYSTQTNNKPVIKSAMAQDTKQYILLCKSVRR